MEGHKINVCYDTFFTHAYHTVAEVKRIIFLIHIVLLPRKYEHAKWKATSAAQFVWGWV